MGTWEEYIKDIARVAGKGCILDAGWQKGVKKNPGKEYLDTGLGHQVEYLPGVKESLPITLLT